MKQKAKEAATIAERDDLRCLECGARLQGWRAGGCERTWQWMFYCPAAHAADGAATHFYHHVAWTHGYLLTQRPTPRRAPVGSAALDDFPF
jgi:hypothetical protein